jgi:outer membrane protein OmpA-like peptidoglycan-associated protein
MSRFSRVAVLGVVCTFVLAITPARAQDEPAKDNPGVPRFPGMLMESGSSTDFDGFDFQTHVDGATQRVEGKSWSFTYALPPGARRGSPLEITRNYANQFTARGGKVLFQLPDASMSTMRMPLGTGGAERWLALTVNNEGEQVMMRIIETAAMKQKVEFSADEMAEQVASTGKVILRGILFDTAKSDIKPESAPVLDEVAAMMKQNAAVRFRIDGHTDNVGSTPANIALSRARAASVKTALITRGVEAARLSSDGFGDAQPVADNATEDGRAQNRRVELVKQ